MAVNLNPVRKKLIQALNSKDRLITFGTRQFIGSRDKKLINVYSINESVWDADKQKYMQEELYSSTSMIRIVLYLRDMWYRVNDWPLPTDNEIWNKMREQIERGEKDDG